jgi:hypothetical protein
MKREIKTPTQEDPVRLRECLNALSEACGHDVFRFETVTTKTGMRFVITASRQVAEVDIAILIATELRKFYDKVELDTEGLEGTKK